MQYSGKDAALAAALTFAFSAVGGASLAADMATQSVQVNKSTLIMRAVTVSRMQGKPALLQMLHRSAGQSQADQSLSTARAQLMQFQPAVPAAPSSLHALIVGATDGHKPFQLQLGASSGQAQLDSNAAEGGFPDLAAFDFNYQSLYPGAIVQGKAQYMAAGQLTPNPATPSGGTLTLNGAHFQNANAKTSMHVSSATNAGVTAALQTLTNQHFSADQGGMGGCTMKQVYSSSQASFGVNASAGYMGMASMSNTFKSADDNHSNHLLVYCQQQYFTISYMPDPTSNALGNEAFFSSNMTPDLVQPYMGSGNPPLFVQSVTYGSELYLLLDSTYSAQDMQDAFSASVNVVFAKGSVSITDHQKNVLDSTTIHTLEIGGRASAQEAVNAGALDGANVHTQLAAYIKASGDFSPSGGQAQEVGLPISYKLAYLDFTPVEEVATIFGTPHQVSPASLSKAMVWFHQNGDGKNDDDEVDIRLLDSGSKEAAHLHIGKNSPFADNSDTKLFVLTLDTPHTMKELMEHGTFVLHTAPSGNDTWHFDAHITLEFSDGSKLSGIETSTISEQKTTMTYPLGTILH